MRRHVHNFFHFVMAGLDPATQQASVRERR
jgi:hypothetical protein